MVMEEKMPSQEDASKTAVTRCLLCEKYVEKNKTFTCRRCKKFGLCLDHVDREYNICVSCATEERIKLYTGLEKQEKNIRTFLRLMQFILMVVSALFVAQRFLDAPFLEELKDNVIFDHLSIWGVLSVLGILLSRILLLSQKQKMKALGERIRDQKIFSRQVYY